MVVIMLRSVTEGVFAQSETSVSSSITSSVVSPAGAVESLNKPLVGSDPSSDRGTSLMSKVRRESSTELRLHQCEVSISHTGLAVYRNSHCCPELPCLDELREGEAQGGLGEEEARGSGPHLAVAEDPVYGEREMTRCEAQNVHDTQQPVVSSAIPGRACWRATHAKQSRAIGERQNASTMRLGTYCLEA